MAHGPVGGSSKPKVKVVARPQKGAGGVATPRSEKLQQPLTVGDVAKMTTAEKLARLGFLGATAADRQVADARAASQPPQPQLRAPAPEPASPSQPYAGWRPGQRTKPAYPGEKPVGVIAVPRTAEHPTGLLHIYKHTPTKAVSEGDVAWHQMVDAIGPDVIQKASNPRVALLHDILGNATGITPLVDSISKHKIAATAANLAMIAPWGRVGKAVTGIEGGVDAVRAARAADEVESAHNIRVPPAVLRRLVRQKSASAVQRYSEGHDISHIVGPIRADNPIAVSFDPATGRAKIEDGNHRLGAALYSNEPDVPVRVKIVSGSLDNWPQLPVQIRAALESRVRESAALAGDAQPGLRTQLADTVSSADQALRDATSGVGVGSGPPLDVRPLLPDRGGPYEPRLLAHNDLTQQMDKSRSRIAQVAQKVIDATSLELQKSKLVTDTPGLRVVSAGERVVKAAGRRQRKDMARRSAPYIDDMKAIDKVKEGAPEDVGNFWYAQLPTTHRTGEGLGLIRAKQAEELDYIASGQALEHLSEREAAVKAQLGEAETGSQAGHLLRELEEIKTLKTDLPQRVDDVTASLHQLDELVANPPAVNHRAIEAADALMRDRERILVEAGRLKPDRAAPRKSLVSRWLGLEPTGEELYLGHRLPKPESFRGSNMPSGGTGRVRSPQGLGSENKLVLAKTGRLRASLRVAAEDWHSAQIFEQANIARHELSALGTKFPGHVPEGHVLVNPKGRTIPAHWKTDELAQFHENYADIDELRTQAQEILDGFIATNKAGFERMKQDAIDQGVSWDELRVVPKRYVDRYYAQFKPSRGRGAAAKGYDAAVDVVATSIVFARIGYIPKNFLQATIMAVPHQGAFLPINAVKAAQVARDRELRHFIQAEIGHTGATGALGNEAMSKRITGAAAGFVSKFADDPARFTAFLHEAAAEGVISRTNPLLTEKDRAALLDLFKNEKKRPLLNDISQRAIDAMGDFSRMTPDQSRMARRYLIIPGWLMAGSRYPFKFAFDHPIRTALLAYIAAGEPGAPEGLQFNRPIDEYFTGSSYRRGIETPWGRVRTGSLSPVNTPWDLGIAAVQTARGKQSPYDIAHETAFDYAQPLAAAGVRIAQGDGVERNLKGLAPNYKLAEGLIHPSASPTYPEDKTRLGRLERELGVVPIDVNDPAGAKTAAQKENEWLTRVQRQVGKVPVEVKAALHTKTLYHDAQDALKKDSGAKGLSDRELTKLKLQVLAAAHPEYAETAHTFRAELDVSPEILPNIDRWAEKALQWDVLDKYSQTADKLKHARKQGDKASGLITAGNIDLHHRTVAHNADGSISTVRSITVEDNGRFVLLPTVVDGRVVPNDQAVEHYRQTGEHLGIFKSEATADAYAQHLHEQQAKEYSGG